MRRSSHILLFTKNKNIHKFVKKSCEKKYKIIYIWYIYGITQCNMKSFTNFTKLYPAFYYFILTIRSCINQYVCTEFKSLKPIAFIWLPSKFFIQHKVLTYHCNKSYNAIKSTRLNFAV